MTHRFFSDDEIELLLNNANWRLAVPGICAQPGLDRITQAEVAWRRRNRHAHTHLEVLVTLRGRGGFGVGEQVLDAGPGLVALLLPGLAHDNGLPPGSGACCQLWLVWLGARVVVHLAEISHSGDRVERRNSTVLASECGTDLARVVEEALAMGGDGGVRRMRTALAAVLAQVVEAGYRPAPSTGRLSSEVLDALRRHLEETGGTGASLLSLARHAGVSRGYFARAFRQATGRTVGGFIDLCRACRAEELSRSGYAQAEIASALGFSSPQSWARWRRRTDRAK